MQNIVDILAIDEAFGITGPYPGLEVLVGDRHFSPPRCFRTDRIKLPTRGLLASDA
jgi:hypothetical protein